MNREPDRVHSRPPGERTAVTCLAQRAQPGHGGRVREPSHQVRAARHARGSWSPARVRARGDETSNANGTPTRIAAIAVVVALGVAASVPQAHLWCDAVVRTDGPSFTARGVAVARSVLNDRRRRPAIPRPRNDSLRHSSPALRAHPATRSSCGDFFDYIAVRTRFFDDAVLRAMADGVHQMVILGAGCDGRALRFRTPGVEFFEVDHPATQRDKQQQLLEVGRRATMPSPFAADFTESGVGTVLSAAVTIVSQGRFLCAKGYPLTRVFQ